MLVRQTTCLCGAILAADESVAKHIESCQSHAELRAKAAYDTAYEDGFRDARDLIAAFLRSGIPDHALISALIDETVDVDGISDGLESIALMVEREEFKASAGSKGSGDGK